MANIKIKRVKNEKKVSFFLFRPKNEKKNAAKSCFYENNWPFAFFLLPL
jgi:hypothetical protein